MTYRSGIQGRLGKHWEHTGIYWDLHFRIHDQYYDPPLQLQASYLGSPDRENRLRKGTAGTHSRRLKPVAGRLLRRQHHTELFVNSEDLGNH